MSERPASRHSEMMWQTLQHPGVFSGVFFLYRVAMATFHRIWTHEEHGVVLLAQGDSWPKSTQYRLIHNGVLFGTWSVNSFTLEEVLEKMDLYIESILD